MAGGCKRGRRGGKIIHTVIVFQPAGDPLIMFLLQESTWRITNQVFHKDSEKSHTPAPWYENQVLTPAGWEHTQICGWEGATRKPMMWGAAGLTGTVVTDPTVFTSRCNIVTGFKM